MILLRLSPLLEHAPRKSLKRLFLQYYKTSWTLHSASCELHISNAKSHSQADSRLKGKLTKLGFGNEVRLQAFLPSSLKNKFSSSSTIGFLPSYHQGGERADCCWGSGLPGSSWLLWLGRWTRWNCLRCPGRPRKEDVTKLNYARHNCVITVKPPSKGASKEQPSSLQQPNHNIFPPLKGPTHCTSSTYHLEAALSHL